MFCVSWLNHAWYTYNRSDLEDLPLNQAHNWATWTPNLPAAGYYYVQAWIPAVNATTAGAAYGIHHAGALYTITLDQGGISGAWEPLGAYDFTATGGEHVYLNDVVPEQGHYGSKIGFDAVKFSYAGPGQPPGDTTPPVIDIRDVWANGAGALSVQPRITDDSGTLAFAELVVNPSRGGQVGQALAPFPNSDYGAHMYAGTRNVGARGPTTHGTTTNRTTTNGEWNELVACCERVGLAWGVRTRIIRWFPNSL